MCDPFKNFVQILVRRSRVTGINNARSLISFTQECFFWSVKIEQNIKYNQHVCTYIL